MAPWKEPVHASTNRLPEDYRIGLIADAGPSLGYGHAVRCLRIAAAFPAEAALFPLSNACRRFFEANGYAAALHDFHAAKLPPVVITDLREPHAFVGSIRRRGAVHISIHDMGLAQCDSDVAIDGSIANAVPYPALATRPLFVGPEYMITRPVVERAPAAEIEDTVLISLGGGASADFAGRIAEQLRPLGMRVVTTAGFSANPGILPATEEEIVHTMAHCRFAISASGTTLYGLLASGVPTIAVAVDRFQLRTADKFAEMGAVLPAGLLDRLSPAELLERCKELRGNGGMTSRMVSIGKLIVDGKGLDRVLDIVNKAESNKWKKQLVPTSTVC